MTNDRDQEWPRSKNDRDQESPRSKAKMTLKMTRRSLTDTTKKFTPFPKTGHETAIWPRITEIKNDRDQKMTEIRNVRDQESPRSKTKMTINTDTTKKWWFHALKCSVETGGLSTLYNRWNRSNITKQEKYNSIGLPSTLGMSMGVTYKGSPRAQSRKSARSNFRIIDFSILCRKKYHDGRLNGLGRSRERFWLFLILVYFIVTVVTIFTA